MSDRRRYSQASVSSPTTVETDHGRHRHPDDRPSHALEQGPTDRPEPPLKLREVWTVRTRLQMAGNIREIALFNLAIDSKLRGCDLVRLMVRDLAHGSQVLARATVVQQKPSNRCDSR